MAIVTQFGEYLRRKYAPEDYARLAAELCPNLDPPPEEGLYPCDQEKKIAVAVSRRTGISPAEFLRLPVEDRVDWLQVALDTKEKKTRERRGKKSPGPSKLDVAITEVVRHPELTDAAIARQAGCSRSYLSRSKAYQKNADLARRALARQQRKAEYDKRSGTLHPIDETRPEDLLDC